MEKTLSTINRRNFLKYTGITGTGFIIGLSLKSTKGIAEVAKWDDDDSSYELTPFIMIEKNGVITIFNPRPEMGQGTFQSIPSLIAEELEVTLKQVTIKQTGGQKKFGPAQFAGGSMSVRSDYFMLRKAGAAAKEMLVLAASQQWKVPLRECFAEDAKVHHKPSGKSIGYADLAQAASKLDVPKKPKLKDPKDFKLLGKKTMRPDVPLKSSGQAVFGIDVEVPGMVYASVAHCPVFGSKLVNFDDTAAKDIKGVIQVETCTRIIGKYKYDGIAVIGENYWSAYQGRKALNIKWDYQGHENFNSKDYDQSLRDLSKTQGVLDTEKGNFDNAFAAAPVQIDAFYETPIVSHSPIEPMNCVANWHDGNKLEIWASTQVPGDIMDNFPKDYNIPPENLKVNVLFNGGAFGRRLYNDVINEAVQLSKKIGKPVKLIWSREDDTQLGPFRPMTYSSMKGGLSSGGKVMAFQHKVISPSLDASDHETVDKTKPDRNMTEALGDQKYEIGNLKVLYVNADSHIPFAAWRAVTSTTIAFANECFIDELAVKAGKDPMAFRLKMLTKESDTKTLLLKLKEISAWDNSLPAGWGRGVAQYEFFAGLAGYVVEVSRKGSGIKIERVIAVIDLGTMVNPDTVKGQVEGAATMALSAAIKNGITFDKGETMQSNYNNNPIVRINEMPAVDVHILANGGPTIKGVGEPGLPSFAPALCNAIFSATGIRIRKLPFDINNIA
jgi:isoquinoline 1-oxidoreductase beta subunit